VRGGQISDEETGSPLLDKIVEVPDEVVFQSVGNEIILLNMKTGSYYSLNPVGSRIWNLLAEKKRPVDAFSSMSEEYDVEPEDLQRDILSLVRELRANGLLDVRD
jgi:hypothetical protein